MSASRILAVVDGDIFARSESSRLSTLGPLWWPVQGQKERVNVCDFGVAAASKTMSDQVRRGLIYKLCVLLWVGLASCLLASAAIAQANGNKPAPAIAPPPATAPAAAATPSSPAINGGQQDIIGPSPPLMPAKTDTEIKVPARPEDPRALKVYNLLEAHCARCHQAGKTEKFLPSGLISNILDVEALGRNSSLVKPSLPDASHFYDIFVSRHAPLDIYASTAAPAPAVIPPAPASTVPQIAEPEPEDIEAVRTWIKDLPPKSATCAGRKLVSAAEVTRLISEAVKAAKDDARDLRFLSLVNLYNTCTSSEDMANYRLAIVKLLNSLSWASEPVQVASLDDNGTVVSFKLSDPGWVSGHWDILQRIYPRGLQVALPDDVKTAVATEIPVFQADWFADAASKPPLYYALLGIPAKLNDLAKINGIDIEQNIKSARARRAVIRQSNVTRGNRLAERHPDARGTFWLSYDFATSSGDQDLFDHPLGPKPSSVVRSPFKPDLVRAIFSLPNGFLGYALFDAAGNRIERAQPGVEKSMSGGDELASHQSQAGANCFECHTQGIKPVRDDLKAHLASDKFAGPKDVRETALQLTALDSDILQFSDGDEERYRSALKAAGIDTSLRIAGQEPVNALARNYQSGGDADSAAAGLGLSLADFHKILGQAPGPAQVLARRLQAGTLARPELDRLLGLLKGPDEAAQSAAFKATKELPKAPLKDDAGAVGLNLWIEKVLPAPGDVIVVNAEADSDCYLTLVSVDSRGKATVLFPNDFENNNLISAGKAVRVPGSEAPYQLRFKDVGQETILGQCSTSPAPPAGIEHDFERQRFTVLGNWENFVHETLVSDADLRRNPDRAEKLRAQRAGAYQQRRQERGESADKRPDTPQPNRNLRDGRAVIVIGSG